MKRVKKITYTIAALVAMFIFIISSIVGGGVGSAYAATSTTTEFDKTNVMDDLNGATIDGKVFNVIDYPYDSTGLVKHPEIMTVVEYCYSMRPAQRNNYGVYVYFYNPQALNINTDSPANKIMLGVSYGTDKDGNITVEDYEKFTLKFCSKSTGDYRDLFYKFKVIDHKSTVDGLTVAQRVNSNARRYDISEVELLTVGNKTATAYGVGGTYTFTGYAKGYGADQTAESTLECEWKALETVELGVKHTFYRSQTSSLGDGYQNQLDTVYFSVPERLIEKYGSLQRIKAEWYEYKTKEILVTSNSDFEEKARPYIGVNLGPKDQYGLQSYNEDIYYSLGIQAGDWGGGLQGAKWGWNLGNGYLHVPCEALYYMFLVNNISEYDPYASIVDIGGVQSNDLYEYIKNYDKTFENGTLPIKEGSISADLFETDIDDTRKIDNESGKIQQGYSYYNFDADVDLQTLKSWSDTKPSFWDNWINFGLGAAFAGGPEEETKIVAPIQILKESDIQGTPTEIANRLLINSSDVNSLKAEYNEAVTVSDTNDEKKVVVLFRFATSNYFSHEVDIMELGKGFLGQDKYTKGQAYIAQESVFFDFDIIDLSFSKGGKLTVVPVVMSPIDIVNDVTPPTHITPDGIDWRKIIALILGLLALILIVVLFAPLLRAIVNAVVWLVCLPFKLIAKLFKKKE